MSPSQYRDEMRRRAAGLEGDLYELEVLTLCEDSAALAGVAIKNAPGTRRLETLKVHFRVFANRLRVATRDQFISRVKDAIQSGAQPDWSNVENEVTRKFLEVFCQEKDMRTLTGSLSLGSLDGKFFGAVPDRWLALCRVPGRPQSGRSKRQQDLRKVLIECLRERLKTAVAEAYGILYENYCEDIDSPVLLNPEVLEDLDAACVDAPQQLSIAELYWGCELGDTAISRKLRISSKNVYEAVNAVRKKLLRIGRNAKVNEIDRRLGRRRKMHGQTES